MPFPKKIKLQNKTVLVIIWDNDRIHNFPLKFLRDESPDAGNKGETILWKHYEPIPKDPDLPGKYEVENIEQIGVYAIKIKWKDGYDFGIYTWELLWQLGEFLEVKNNLNQELDNDPSHHNSTEK